MENKKLVVWDLFGGGQNSVVRALNNSEMKNEFFVYTFDVVKTHKESFRGQLEVDNQKYIEIDLSQNDICEKFEEMIKNNTIQKPDIIVSSTLCQSFSKVLSMTGGGTCFWKQSERYNKESTLIERSVEEFEKLKSGFTKNLKAEKQLFIKRLGQKCCENSVELIRGFAPKAWYIENPTSSLLFQYLRVNLRFGGVENVACFGSYGFAQNKEGTFYSNVEVNLKRDKKPATYETQWEEVSKEYYDNWINNVNEKRKLGGSGDTRHVKKCVVDGKEKYFRRWYVDIGYKIGDKGHCSMKKTSMTLGKLVKHKFVLKNENDFDSKQISEANETSHIPEGVIQEIFREFIKKCKV